MYLPVYSRDSYRGSSKSWCICIKLHLTVVALHLSIWKSISSISDQKFQNLTMSPIFNMDYHGIKEICIFIPLLRNGVKSEILAKSQVFFKMTKYIIICRLLDWITTKQMTLVESGKLAGLDSDWKNENWPPIDPQMWI